ncbi:MAG: alginate export family protein [Oceanicaulis sp.]
MLALAALLVAQPTDTAPRFTLSGEVRARYESLDGQFRAGVTGGDQLLAFRSLLHGQVDFGAVAFGVELQDSRAYLDDSGTPLSSSYVNALDILQAYASIDAPSPFGSASFTLGRQTVSIGSKRQIERVSYANVIKAYTGAHYVARSEGREFHAVALAPIDRRPGDRESVGENEVEADREQWNRFIWGLHYRRRLDDRTTWLEGFVYGLSERDSSEFPTPNRQYVTPGLRAYRAPSVGALDFDLEAALRFGTRRAGRAPGDTRDLDVFAGMAVAQIGYTFDTPWRLRLAGEYYYASGDEDPNDDRFDQYERLFGGRRTDLNNTSLHGPFTPANLSAPGLRLSGRPSERSDFWLRVSAPSLASATDSWVIARLRDPSGRSGRFLGHAVDGRLRHRPVAGLELEAGASALVFDGFAERVAGAPEAERTLFGYVQAAYSF